MGLFDLLTTEGRKKGALRRHSTRVANKYAQSADRFASMEKLREDGSEEALFALMKRFSYKYDKSIEDEQEKEWVVSVLVAKGDAAIPAVRRYAKQSDSWSWALKILAEIVKPPLMLEIVDELLGREDPGYTRDPSRKNEMMTFLGEWKNGSAAEIGPRVVPYLADFDENVRFQAIEAMSHAPHESGRLPTLAALLRPEEESRRIKARLCDLLAQTGWTVTEHKDEVARLLESGFPEYGLHHDKLQRKAK